MSIKESIIDHIVANKFRLNAEMQQLVRDRADLLNKEHKDFHNLINDQFKQRVRSHVIKDLSMNLGVDFETSISTLEETDLVKALDLLPETK